MPILRPRAIDFVRLGRHDDGALTFCWRLRRDNGPQQVRLAAGPRADRRNPSRPALDPGDQSVDPTSGPRDAGAVRRRCRAGGAAAPGWSWRSAGATDAVSCPGRHRSDGSDDGGGDSCWDTMDATPAGGVHQLRVRAGCSGVWRSPAGGARSSTAGRLASGSLPSGVRSRAASVPAGSAPAGRSGGAGLCGVAGRRATAGCPRVFSALDAGSDSALGPADRDAARGAEPGAVGTGPRPGL